MKEKKKKIILNDCCTGYEIFLDSKHIGYIDVEYGPKSTYFSIRCREFKAISGLTYKTLQEAINRINKEVNTSEGEQNGA